MNAETPCTDAAIAHLPRGAELLIRLGPPVHCADYVVQAREALRLGAIGQAAGLTGKGLDAYARRRPSRHPALWLAALNELAALTGAQRSPCMRVIYA